MVAKVTSIKSTAPGLWLKTENTLKRQKLFIFLTLTLLSVFECKQVCVLKAGLHIYIYISMSESCKSVKFIFLLFYNIYIYKKIKEEEKYTQKKGGKYPNPWPDTSLKMRKQGKSVSCLTSCLMGTVHDAVWFWILAYLGGHFIKRWSFTPPSPPPATLPFVRPWEGDAYIFNLLCRQCEWQR